MKIIEYKSQKQSLIKLNRIEVLQITFPVFLILLLYNSVDCNPVKTRLSELEAEEETTNQPQGLE